MTSEERNLISLREYLETLITENRNAEAVRWKTHEHVHLQEAEARKLALANIDRRLEEMNKFRDQINLERGEFLPKENFYIKHEEISKRLDNSVDQIYTRINDEEKWRSNIEGRLWMLGVVITVVSILINLGIRVIFK